MRFRTLAQRCLPMINVRDIKDVMLSDSDAWHLLETHMTLPHAANSKAYKQWLFARTEGSPDAPFDIVQGGATLLMRSVVREHLRKEYSPTSHVSTNQPPAANDSATAMNEAWLSGTTDTRDSVALRELRAMASQDATARFGQLDTRTRLALAARHFRVALSSLALLALAQCGKSAMHSAYRDAATSLLDDIRATYSGEDETTVRELALLTFESLTHCCVEWAIQADEYDRVLRANAPATDRLEVAP
jgi:hypothetical protein